MSITSAVHLLDEAAPPVQVDLSLAPLVPALVPMPPEHPLKPGPILFCSATLHADLSTSLSHMYDLLRVPIHTYFSPYCDMYSESAICKFQCSPGFSMLIVTNQINLAPTLTPR